MSQLNKLNYVDGKLGAPTSGQQTTRILFNTIENPGVTSSLVFFKNFQGLTNGQTNLVQNRLDSAESMIVKTIMFMQYGSDGILFPFAQYEQTTVSVLIGNQTVVKNLPLQFNAGRSGQTYDRLHENGGVELHEGFFSRFNQKVQPTEIRLLTDIVIPPQVAFEVRVDGSNVNFQDGAIVCVLSGYGKIFSAGMSF